MPINRQVAPPPLQGYAAVGLIERWEGAADVRVRGGNCWHCGTAIAYCVVIRNAAGDEHEIGTTCAELLGLDITQIKQLRANKRAAERWQAAQQRRQHAPSEPVTPSHGTLARFHTGCYCLPCIDAALTALPNEYAVGTKSIIIDLSTGQPARATLVNTRFGQSWRVNDGTWLTAHPRPKRRTTHAAKGYVEAEVPCLFRYGWRRRPGGPGEYTETTLCPLASPLRDIWNTPIPRTTSKIQEQKHINQPHHAGGHQ